MARLQDEVKSVVIPQPFRLLRRHGLREILDFRSNRVLALRVLRPKLPPTAKPEIRSGSFRTSAPESPRRDTNLTVSLGRAIRAGDRADLSTRSFAPLLPLVDNNAGLSHAAAAATRGATGGITPTRSDAGRERVAAENGRGQGEESAIGGMVHMTTFGICCCTASLISVRMASGAWPAMRLASSSGV